MKFSNVVGIRDVTTNANFGDDRLRGLRWRGSNFALCFRRCPYILQQLLCECV